MVPVLLVDGKRPHRAFRRGPLKTHKVSGLQSSNETDILTPIAKKNRVRVRALALAREAIPLELFKWPSLRK